MSAALQNTIEIDFSGDFQTTETEFNYSDNELFNLSSSLLSILVTLERLQKPENLSVFKSLLKQHIIDLSEKGKQSKYPSAVIDKLCCLHSIVLDEFIIHSTWGEGIGWEHNTLLSELFNLQNGGDLFYTITDKALRQPEKMQDLLGMVYVFLQIGFKGRYRSRQSEKLATVSNQVKAVLDKGITAPRILIEDSPKNRSLRLSSGRRYLQFLILIIVAIIAGWIFFDYWFEETYSARSREFQELDKVIASYQNGEQMPIKEESAPQVGTAHVASNNADVNSVAPASSSTLAEKMVAEKYVVQLQSFTTEENANKYLSAFGQSKYPLDIKASGKYFIIFSLATSQEQAEMQKTYFKENHQLSVFVYALKGTE